jgi:hypothetical protein
MKEYNIKVNDTEFIKVKVQDGGGTVETNLYDSQDDTEILWQSGLDGITSLILAHACIGIDVEDERYVEGVQTAVEACANSIS